MPLFRLSQSTTQKSFLNALDVSFTLTCRLFFGHFEKTKKTQAEKKLKQIFEKLKQIIQKLNNSPTKTIFFSKSPELNDFCWNFLPKLKLSFSKLGLKSGNTKEFWTNVPFF